MKSQRSDAGAGPQLELRISTPAVTAGMLAFLFVIPSLDQIGQFSAPIAGTLVLLPFLGVLYVQILILNRGFIATVSPRSKVLYWAIFLGVLVVSMIRSNHPSHTGPVGFLLAGLWLSIGVATLLIVTEAARSPLRLRPAFLLGLTFSAVLFVGLNVALYLFGFESGREIGVRFPDGQLGSLLGLQIERTLLPLARGFNNFGVLAGLALASSCALLLNPRSSRLLRLVSTIGVSVSLIALVIVDSRGPLLFGLLAGIGVAITLHTRAVMLIRLAIPLAPFSPLILLAVLSIAADSGAAKMLSRQPGDIASATNRSVIWAAAAGNLALAPSAKQFVGYGQYGPKGAGISSVWAPLFRGFDLDPTLTSTHNMALQLIYDVGYAGLFLVLLAMWWCSGRLVALYRSTEDPSAAGLLAALLFIVIAGTTEATISIGFPEILIFLMLLIAAVGADWSNSRGPTSRQLLSSAA